MFSTELLESVRFAIEQRQCEAPWGAGLTLLGLSKRLRLPEEELAPALAAFTESGLFVHRAGYYMTPEFAPELTEPQRAFFDAAVPLDPQPSLLPVVIDRVAKEMKFARIAGLHHAFEALLATGVMVQVGGDLYRAAQIEAIRGLLEEALRAGGGITPAQFRDLIGTSRKHALPLLEWFDAAGVTVRVGDVRQSARNVCEQTEIFIAHHPAG